MLVAMAQAKEASEKPARHQVNSQRVDISRDSQAESGIMMTSAVSEAVNTQLIWAGPAARPP